MRFLATVLLTSTCFAGCGGKDASVPKEALRCEGEACQDSCADYFGAQDCAPTTWCKPTGSEGLCVAPECGSSVAAICIGDAQCISVAEGMGACVVPCTYGFVSNTYRDDCTDTEIDLACQPVGVADQAVCLPVGTLEAGQPGCDIVTAACIKGSVCVDIVCRTLCRENQEDLCPVGESCLPVSPASDVFICKAP